MKTSTKLLVVGIILLLTALATYNTALRAEYQRGTFRNPYRDYTTLSLRNFSEIEVVPGSRVPVKVVAGPYAVRRHSHADSVEVVQVGQRLRIIDHTRKGQGPRYSWPNNLLVISCPRLDKVLVNTPTVAKPLGAMSTTWRTDVAGATVRIEGFVQDSLLLSPDQNSSVQLAQNQLGRLRVVAGTTPRSTAAVVIAPDNRIQSARLIFHNKSQLTLDALAIPDLRYQFADSARATLAGVTLRTLRP